MRPAATDPDSARKVTPAADSDPARVLIVSPVRNEGAHIARIVAAVRAQRVQPARWILLDDGSTDDTLAQLRELTAALPYATVLTLSDGDRPGGGDRLAHAAAPRNFNRALAHVDWRAYSHVMKLDGDVELPPGYLSDLLDRFRADPRLGLAGGVLAEPRPGREPRLIRIPRHHVHGAVKLYSRACFGAIGGVQERLGWDTIDETYARMRGFRTLSFADLVALHHRPLASADGVLRGRARHGRCAYIVHYPLAWVLLRSLKIAALPPRGLSGLAFLYGYLRAAALGEPRVADPVYRAFTRAELRRRLTTRRWSASVASARGSAGPRAAPSSAARAGAGRDASVRSS